jgi:serine protease Do/serine protease DegQ
MTSIPSVPVGLLLIFLVIAVPAAEATLPVAVGGKELPSLAPMLERVTPGVVNVATRATVRVRNQLSPFFNDPFFRRFFDVPQMESERETQSLGSGVVVDARRGFVLTNYHVIENADEIKVTLEDGRELLAEVIGYDTETDVAVINIPPEDLTAIPLGDSEDLRVGDFVVAIGNPFGLGQTVTSGIVSALGRSGLGIESYEDFIQTDAAINVGNSGGALVNLRGELVGLNTAILGGGGGSRGNIGIGFAIPVNMAKGVMEQLVAYGEVRRGRLGIQAQGLTSELATALSIREQTGVVVTLVERDSPAERAGVAVGDLIVEVDGRPVRRVEDVRNIVGLVPVGETIELRLVRDGRQRRVSARIEQSRVSRIDGERLSPRLAGAVIEEVKQTELGRGSVQAVVVVEVTEGSPAWYAGLRHGDVIRSVNKVAVKSVDELRNAVGRGGGQLLLNIQRGNSALFVLLK